MSHINEALRKAQKERDAVIKYSGILSSGRSDKRGIGRRALRWTVLFLILVLVTFAAYLWWDSREKQTSAVTGPKLPSIDAKAERARKVRTARSRALPRAKASPPEAVRSARAPRPEPALGAQAFYDKARLFHKRGRLQDAKRFYQETLRLDPGYVDALNNLGVLYIRDKDYDAALSSFENAIQLKPDYVDAYYNLACLYAIKGDARQSLDHLKKAASLDLAAKAWAREDTDLENLHGLPEFDEIVK